MATVVRTIDSHASTTATCSSNSEEEEQEVLAAAAVELTNVWAIPSMPAAVAAAAETIATTG